MPDRHTPVRDSIGALVWARETSRRNGAESSVRPTQYLNKSTLLRIAPSREQTLHATKRQNKALTYTVQLIAGSVYNSHCYVFEIIPSPCVRYHHDPAEVSGIVVAPGAAGDNSERASSFVR